MSEREDFIRQHETGRFSMTELCSAFGVSRTTGYRLLDRYQKEGVAGLEDQSRAPLTRPNRTPREVVERIVAARLKHPTWAAKKIRPLLEGQSSDIAWPARSTIDAILKREGLVLDRRRKRHPEFRSAPVAHADRPNEIWSVDYKGWFRVGDGTKCEPLTINDTFSRFSLCCRSLGDSSGQEVQKAFVQCFEEFGLPRAILSDNGTPFGSNGIRSLTWLSVWFLRLGILPTHIQPGKPYQNGKHERFHLTLQQDAASPPKATKKAQEKELERFRHIYNHERPHEAIGMLRPADLYEKSIRPYEGDPGDFEYDCKMETRRVRVRGYIPWNGENLFIGEAMRDQLIGLEPIGPGKWRVWIGPLALGDIDSNTTKMKKLRALAGKPRGPRKPPS